MDTVIKQATKIASAASESEVKEILAECTALAESGALAIAELTGLMTACNDRTSKLSRKAAEDEASKPAWQRERYVKAGKPYEPTSNQKGEPCTMWRFGGAGRYKEQQKGVKAVINDWLDAPHMVAAWLGEDGVQQGKDATYDVRDELNKLNLAAAVNSLLEAAYAIADEYNIQLDDES